MYAERERLRKVVATYAAFLDWYADGALRPWFQRAVERLPGLVEAFADEPGKDRAGALLRGFRNLGHILEIALDPESAYVDRLTPEEVRGGLEALATAIESWYAPDRAAARAALRSLRGARGVRTYQQLLDGHLLHAHHAFRIWKDAKVRRTDPAFSWNQRRGRLP